MRLVRDAECPLCKCRSGQDNAFFPEYDDGLLIPPVHSMFHPTGIHWDCYLDWPGRKSFARGLFARLVKEAGTLRGKAYADDHLAILVPVTGPGVLELVLAETGRRLRVTWVDWDRWQLNPETVAVGCHPVERESLRQCLVSIWQRFPDLDALLAVTNWLGTERHLYAWPNDVP